MVPKGLTHFTVFILKMNFVEQYIYIYISLLYQYEASDKLNYLLTHYALHYFIDYAVASLCKS